MTIICQICRTQFMSTAKPPALTEHAQNKHGKTLGDCFRGFSFFVSFLIFEKGLLFL